MLHQISDIKFLHTVASSGIHVYTRKREGTGGHYVAIGKSVFLTISDIVPS